MFDGTSQKLRLMQDFSGKVMTGAIQHGLAPSDALALVQRTMLPGSAARPSSRNQTVELLAGKMMFEWIELIDGRPTLKGFDVPLPPSRAASTCAKSVWHGFANDNTYSRTGAIYELVFFLLTLSSYIARWRNNASMWCVDRCARLVRHNAKPPDKPSSSGLALCPTSIARRSTHDILALLRHLAMYEENMKNKSKNPFK